MASKIRRASLEMVRTVVQDVTASEADATKNRRMSLTIMNCVWGRNTDIETIEPVEGEVSGTIPSWLSGTFYRVGPGILQVGNACFNHPFEMLSVVHKYTVESSDHREARLRRQRDVAASRTAGDDDDDGDDDSGGGGGGNTYRNKVIESKSKERAITGHSPIKEMHRNRLSRVTSFLRGSRSGGGDDGGHICDNCIDNICFFGNDMYIMSDIAHMLKIHEDTLDTLAHHDIEECIPVRLTTSHPHVEEDGIIWNVGTSHTDKRGFYYSVIKYEKKNPSWSGTMVLENAEVHATIPARHKHSPSYYHSFGLTEDYLVFIEQPLFLHEERNGGGAGAVSAASVQVSSGNAKWKKTEMVNIYLVCKKTGKVSPTVYTCEPFFFFHVINAYQKDDDSYIFVDLLAYKDSDILTDLLFTNILHKDKVNTAKPIRLKLPLKSNFNSCKMVVRKEVLVQDATMEFPRINYNYLGKENKYFYAMGNDYLRPNRVLKVDTFTGDVTTWKDPGYFVSEAVFVARPDPKSEDDGILIFTLLSGASLNNVQLIILDAVEMKEEARITYRADGPVTQGFHGIFVRESDAYHRY